MSALDASLVQQSLAETATSKLDELEVFGSIASTNTHLLAQPAPAVGRFRVALADHQTSGRGRHSRRWLSSPGAGLLLSIAYTFPRQPAHLPALTLAIGVGIIGAFKELDIEGISLKWPNDIVALGGKLGGVLTELQAGAAGMTIVTGVGVNVDLPGELDFGLESDWAHRAVDLKSVRPDYPAREIIAGTLISALHAAIATYEAQGFAAFIDEWRRYDWLLGKEITVDMPERQITGVAAGVDEDGALLVDAEQKATRIISGSIVMAGGGKPGQ